VEVEPINDIYAKMTLRPFVPEEGDDGEEIPITRIAKILDGQHRIAGFLDDQNKWMFNDSTKTFFFNIAIFVSADIAQQANIFATVNLAQTKVNKSLVYDLSELAKTDSPHKTCHNVAVALDREETSPFFKRIKRLSSATPGRRAEPLTQAAFVESLIPFISKQPSKDRNLLFEGKRLSLATAEELQQTPFRNLFIQRREVDITEILYNYFTAIRAKWPHSWDAYDVTGNLLPRSSAFKAFMKYLREDVYLDAVGSNIGSVPDRDVFAIYFDDLDIEDSDFTRQNFVPGSGGQSMFLKMLRRDITLDDMVEN
jgi:DGQHR domain-containing protein